jgi:hypothetical protein
LLPPSAPAPIDGPALLDNNPLLAHFRCQLETVTRSGKMIEKSKFDFKAIPRGVDKDLSDALATYLAVFRAITGTADRVISYEALSNVAFLSNWRRGMARGQLDFDRYKRLVAYMDRKLIEKSGVEFDKLGVWINRQLRDVSDDEFEAAQVLKLGAPFKRKGSYDNDRRTTDEKRPRTPGGLKKQRAETGKREGH